MNYIDIILVIPIVWFGYKGFNNGLVRELASIIALVAGIYASFKFSDWVEKWINNDKIPHEIYFAITFFAVLVLVFMAGRFVEKIVKLVIPEFVNNIAGALFGAAKVLVVFSALLFFINSIDSKEVLITPKTKQDSFLYKYVEPAVPKLKSFYDKQQITE
jgi:membrane protein required for colicin V production